MIFDRYKIKSKSLIRIIRNADIDPDDFRLMDEEERLEALDDAGLDPDDFDDFL